jgi:hypothetical protein
LGITDGIIEGAHQLDDIHEKYQKLMLVLGNDLEDCNNFLIVML